MMNLKSFVALLFAMSLVCSPHARAGEDARIQSAFEYFFPLYEMARLRWNAVMDSSNPNRAAPNGISHRRGLLDHTFRTVTASNNDTLYSTSRIDLADGPVRVSTPAIHGRYYSLHFMDFYTENIAILGSGSAGAGPLEVWVVGPAWQGATPPGAQLVRSTTNDVWMLVRILIDGPADLPEVNGIQNQVKVTSMAGLAHERPQKVKPLKDPEPSLFLAVINEMLQRNPPVVGQVAWVRSLEAVGIRPGEADAWDKLDADMKKAWLDAWPRMMTGLRNVQHSYFTRDVKGWQYPPADVGQFGANYRLRAMVALSGIAPLNPSEALYISANTDSKSEILMGSHRYKLTIPRGGIPVNGFWSITMYEVMPDGRFFFTDNPLKRYSVGNRTAGLVKNADGSIDLIVQHAQPGDPAQAANWLPAPKGPFRFALRAYLPKPELVAGEAPLPVVQRID